MVLVGVIVLLDRVDRNPDVAACEHQRRRPAHNPRSLISAVIVRSQESIISKLATRNISAF